MDVHLSDLPHEAARHPEVIVVFAIGCLVLGGAAWWLAPRRGWVRGPAVLAGCGLSLALAVTLVRPLGEYPAGGFDPWDVAQQCVLGPLSLARTYEKLNVAMLMPFAFFAALATRRPVLVVTSSLAVSAGVEYVQGATGIGTCQARDVAHNLLGAVLATLLAMAVAALLRHSGPLSAARAGGREPSR